MFGLTRQSFIPAVSLFVFFVGLSLTWSYLPHYLFGVIALPAVAVIGTAAVTASRRVKAHAVGLAHPIPAQVAAIAPRPPSAPVPPGRRLGRRSGQRTEVLKPEDLVTLAAERQSSGVGEVLADLDAKLVGLYPVKHKVEGSPPC